ncbi:hypothetical protein [Saccharicrinis sp. GN24d3]|uniref:hypothetical protein n=1 Tax=Saccharicrinis sp. GN24d3 TaxID=3458416 RepID=UPI004035BFDB
MNAKNVEVINSLFSEVLENLGNPNSYLLTSIIALNKLAKVLYSPDLYIWTEIQMGNPTYTTVLEDWVRCYIKNRQEKTKETKELLKKATQPIDNLGIIIGSHITPEELMARSKESGGGFRHIGFIEAKYKHLLKTNKENQGVYNRSHLATTLSIIKSMAYRMAVNNRIEESIAKPSYAEQHE